MVLRSSIALAALVLLPALWPVRALGQRRADLMEEGISLREQGRDEEALAMFALAFEQTGSARAQAQMALAEQALERFVEAEAHLADALTHTDDVFIRRNHQALEGALEEIRRRLGDLEVVGGVPGAEVVIGGVAVGVMPLDAPVRVVAGSIAVEIRADGFQRYVDTVQVRGGGSATVEAHLVPTAVVDERDTGGEVGGESTGDAGASAPGWVLPAGLALAGVGVVGIALGSGLMVVREDRAQQRQSCSDTEPDCRAAYGAAVDAEAGGIASYVIGGALLAGGATVLVLGMTGALGGSEGSANESEVSLRCAPGPLSIACAGTF